MRFLEYLFSQKVVLAWEESGAYPEDTHLRRRRIAELLNEFPPQIFDVDLFPRQSVLPSPWQL